jgi:chromosome segregation ATPase
VQLLETELDRKKKTLLETEEKLSALEKEHEGYKVRAQSVLRQAKETDTKLGSKSQELMTLERMVQSLNEKIESMR